MGGCQTVKRSKMYIKFTKWIISYKKVCGRRPCPTTPLISTSLSERLLCQRFPRPRHVGLYLQFLYRTCVNTETLVECHQSSSFALTLLQFDLITIDDNSISLETTYKPDHVLDQSQSKILSRSFTQSFHRCHQDLMACEWNLGLSGD